tara:strand:+ start:55 stop:156 length:102 start_codon:yes stop_codon:yes gene_type:complete
MEIEDQNGQLKRKGTFNSIEKEDMLKKNKDILK